MELCNDRLEFSVIKTICEGKKLIATSVIAKCRADSFYNDAAAAAYRRILAVAKTTSEFPSWEEICSDPVIKESHRKELVCSEPKLATDKIKASKLVFALDRYRKLRNLYLMCESGIESLSKDSVDIDEVLETSSETLMNLRTNARDLDNQLIHFGKGNNSSGLVKSRLNNTNPNVVPTGFRDYDDMNGGFTYGSLVTIAATTGGGKTAVAGIQLLINMSAYEPTCLVSLEMTAEECTDRILANLGGVKVNKFSMGKLSEEEKKRAALGYSKWVKEQKERDTRYTIWSPDEDVSIEEILYGLLPFGYRVILVDYIGLLKGVDGDDQWRQLSNAARFAKIFAKTHNVIVILLAQSSEEGKLRYAKAIGEHSNNCIVGDAWIETDCGLVRMDEWSGQRVHTGVANNYVLPNAFKSMGVKPVYRLDYGRGYHLSATKDHRVRVLDATAELIWKELGNLSPTDCVVVPKLYKWVRTQPVIAYSRESIRSPDGRVYAVQGSVPGRLSHNLSLWLGMWLGDGWVSRGEEVAVTTMDEESKDLLIYLFEECFGIKAKVAVTGAQFKVHIYSKLVAGWLESVAYTNYNLSHKAQDKIVPAFMYGAPKASVCGFLKGLFTTDGSNYTGNGNGGAKISFFNTSEPLVRYVQLMLLRLGITTSTGVREQKLPVIAGRQVISAQPLWSLVVQGGRQILEFHRLIGFVQTRKNVVVAAKLDKRELLPVCFHNRLSNLLQPSWVQRLLSAKTGIRLELLRNRKFMSWVKSVDINLYKTLSFIKCSPMHLMPVMGKKYVGMRPVYDLSVPEAHSFVANGAMVHNCWMWVYTEVSRETGIIDVVQHKARNQDPAPFQIWHDFAYMRAGNVDNRDIPEKVQQESAKNRKRVEDFSHEVDSFVLDMGSDD